MVNVFLSPCPNDLFLISGCFLDKSSSLDLDMKVHFFYEDIEKLNQRALLTDCPIIKISSVLYPKISSRYHYLPVGAAMGSSGPLLVKKKNDPSPKSILWVPGINTTAFALWKIFSKNSPMEIREEIFHKIPFMVNKYGGMGLLIHELKFSLQENCLETVVDFGPWWTNLSSGLLLPLGLFVAHKSLSHKTTLDITKKLQKSLKWAWKNQELALEFSAKSKDLKSLEITKQHIKSYVTQETYSLSAKGEQALSFLHQKTLEAGP